MKGCPLVLTLAAVLGCQGATDVNVSSPGEMPRAFIDGLGDYFANNVFSVTMGFVESLCGENVDSATGISVCPPTITPTLWGIPCVFDGTHDIYLSGSTTGTLVWEQFLNDCSWRSRSDPESDLEGFDIELVITGPGRLGESGPIGDPTCDVRGTVPGQQPLGLCGYIEDAGSLVHCVQFPFTHELWNCQTPGTVKVSWSFSGTFSWETRPLDPADAQFVNEGTCEIRMSADGTEDLVNFEASGPTYVVELCGWQRPGGGGEWERIE